MKRRSLRLWTVVHRWSSLVCTAFLLMLCVTGLPSIFHDEIDAALGDAYRSGEVSIDDEFRRAGVIGGAFDFRGDAVRLSLDVAYQRVVVRTLRPKVTIATATIPRVPGEWDVADNAML